FRSLYSFWAISHRSAAAGSHAQWDPSKTSRESVSNPSRALGKARRSRDPRRTACAALARRHARKLRRQRKHHREQAPRGPGRFLRQAAVCRDHSPQGILAVGSAGNLQPHGEFSCPAKRLVGRRSEGACRPRRFFQVLQIRLVGGPWRHWPDTRGYAPRCGNHASLDDPSCSDFRSLSGGGSPSFARKRASLGLLRAFERTAKALLGLLLLARQSLNVQPALVL